MKQRRYRACVTVIIIFIIIIVIAISIVIVIRSVSNDGVDTQMGEDLSEDVIWKGCDVDIVIIGGGGGGSHRVEKATFLGRW